MKVKLSQKIFKEGILVLITNIFSVLINIFSVIIISSKLNLSQYGSLALALTFQSFFLVVFFGSINNGVLRISSLSIQLNRLSEFINLTLKTSFFTAVILLLCMIILVLIFIIFGNTKFSLPFIIITITSIITGIGDFLKSIILSLRDRLNFLILKLIEGGLIIFFLWYITFDNYIYVFLIYSFTYLISLIISILLFKKSLFSFSFLFSRRDFYWIKRILNYSQPFLIWGGFGWAQQISTKWALDIFVSRSDLGLFNALFQIGYSPVIIFFGVLMNFITPIIFQKINPNSLNNDSKMFLKNFLLVCSLAFVFLILIVLIMIPFSSVIIDLIFPEDYKQISKYLPYMILASGLYSVGNLLTNIPFSLSSPKVLLFSSIFSSIIGVILSFSLVYFLGFKGGVYALILHAIIYSSLTFFSVIKTYETITIS